MKEEPILRLCDVSFAYHGGKPALRHVSLDIHAGEKIAVLGPNGAGKSTFFLNINGVLSPTEGTICYKGMKITRKNLNELRKGVGIIFQDADNQMIAPSVREEISFGPMNLKLPKEEVESRVDNAVGFMNLKGFEDRPPHYLSGGEKKRVSIADIIAMDPDVFLFDEPTASLDPANAEQLELVLDLLSRRKKTLLISTHDVDFAYRWADRVIVFKDGRVRADGTPLAVFSQQELCKEANLKSPALFQVVRLLEQKNLLKEKGRTPKTLTELEALLR
ncbi:MAG: ABC transporter ATP-binding protein [Lachnospiraceae bacterium]|nr:ABC transporter ATP-binding protein [Lachnospiraceae bacterium]